MKKNFYLFILFYFVLVGFVYAAPDLIKVKSTLDCFEKELGSQIYLKDKNYEISAINIESEHENYFMGALNTRYFGVGKLKNYGLFAESLNPCGYNPSSDIFFARTCLGIDKGISLSGKKGIWARPVPWLNFYSVWNDDEENICGISLNFESEYWYFALLFQDSEAGEEVNESQWYLSTEHENESREIINIYSEINYINRWFSVLFCLGTCCGDYVESGIFNRDMISIYCFSWLELNLLFSGTSENYVAATGKIPKSQYRYGFDAVLRPVTDGKIRFTYYNNYERPDLNDVIRNDFMENYSAEVSYSPGDFKFSVSFDGKNKYVNDGTLDKNMNLEAAALFSNGIFYLQAKNTWYWEDFVFVRDSFTAGGKISLEYFRGEVTYTRNIDYEIRDKWKCKIVFRGKSWEMSSSYEMDSDSNSRLDIVFLLEIR